MLPPVTASSFTVTGLPTPACTATRPVPHLGQVLRPLSQGTAPEALQPACTAASSVLMLQQPNHRHKQQAGCQRLSCSACSHSPTSTASYSTYCQQSTRFDLSTPPTRPHAHTYFSCSACMSPASSSSTSSNASSYTATARMLYEAGPISS